MAIVDGHRRARTHLNGEEGAEATDRQLSPAARLGDDEAAGAAEQGRAQALALQFHIDTVGAGDEGPVGKFVLDFAHLQNFHAAGHDRGQQAIAVAVAGGDALLEEALVVGKAAHHRVQKAAVHLAGQLQIGLHHDHGVAFAGDAFAPAQADVQEGVVVAGERKLSHDFSPLD